MFERLRWPSRALPTFVVCYKYSIRKRRPRRVKSPVARPRLHVHRSELGRNRYGTTSTMPIIIWYSIALACHCRLPCQGHWPSRDTCHSTAMAPSMARHKNTLRHGLGINDAHFFYISVELPWVNDAHLSTLCMELPWHCHCGPYGLAMTTPSHVSRNATWDRHGTPCTDMALP